MHESLISTVARKSAENWILCRITLKRNVGEWNGRFSINYNTFNTALNRNENWRKFTEQKENFYQFAAIRKLNSGNSVCNVLWLLQDSPFVSIISLRNKRKASCSINWKQSCLKSCSNLWSSFLPLLHSSQQQQKNVSLLGYAGVTGRRCIKMMR